MKIQRGKKQIKIEISEADLLEKIEEIENCDLLRESKEFFVEALRALVRLDELIGMKETTIARLRKIFDKKSEKREKSDPEKKKDPKKPKSKDGNNGRKDKDDYPTAETVTHSHETLKPGDKCPECGLGSLGKYEPGIYIKVTGSAPLTATIHQTEKFRCNVCLKIFEADYEGKNTEKYNYQAKSIIALLKYGSSTPFYRLEQIHKHLLTPLPSSTQWDLMENLSNGLICVWKSLIEIGSNGEIGYIDDTTAKILDLMKDNRLK